jgi:hypothetical protein
MIFRHVATAEDHFSARRNENCYHFLLRGGIAKIRKPWEVAFGPKSSAKQRRQFLTVELGRAGIVLFLVLMVGLPAVVLLIATGVLSCAVVWLVNDGLHTAKVDRNLRCSFLG